MRYEHERYWEKVEQKISRPVMFPAKAPELLDAMKLYLVTRELNPEIALKSGWYPSVYNGPRIIVPCKRTDGVFWQGRLLEGVTDMETLGKRWDSPLGSKGDAVVYFDGPKDLALIIVEGPLDALAAAGCGFGSVAILGSNPTGSTLDHLAKIGAEYGRRVIVFDRDAAGSWSAIQARLINYGLFTRLVEPWSPAKDLADMSLDTREIFLNEV